MDANESPHYANDDLGPVTSNHLVTGSSEKDDSAALQVATTVRALKTAANRKLKLQPLTTIDVGACGMGLIYLAVFNTQPMNLLALFLISVTCVVWKGIPGGRSFNTQLNWSSVRKGLLWICLAAIIVLIAMTATGLDSLGSIMRAQCGPAQDWFASLVSNVLLFALSGTLLLTFGAAVTLFTMPVVHLLFNVITAIRQLSQLELYRNGEPAEATIVGLTQRSTLVWSIEVTTPDIESAGPECNKSLHLSIDVFNTQCDHLKEGDSVTVLYNKRDPRKCLIYELGQYRALGVPPAPTPKKLSGSL